MTAQCQFTVMHDVAYIQRVLRYQQYTEAMISQQTLVSAPVSYNYHSDTLLSMLCTQVQSGTGQRIVDACCMLSDLQGPDGTQLLGMLKPCYESLILNNLQHVSQAHVSMLIKYA